MKNPNPADGGNRKKPAANVSNSKPPGQRRIYLSLVLFILTLCLFWNFSGQKLALKKDGGDQQSSSTAAHAPSKTFRPKMNRLQDGGDHSQVYTEFATSVMDPQYVFDVNRASGTERFLIGTKWDREFVPDSDAIIGRELWVTDSSGKERLVHGSVTRASFSPDGSKLAYVTTENVLHAETFEGKSLGSVDRAFDPSWRHDGKEIVFSKVPEGSDVWPARELRLAVWDYAADTVEVLTSGYLDDIHGQFGPTGDWLLFVSAGRSGWASFYSIPRAGGEPVPLTNRDMEIPVPYNRMMWSKDGRWFIYDAKDGDIEETWALEIDSNGRLQQAKKLARALDPQVLDDGTIVSTKRTADSIEAIISQLPSSGVPTTN